MPDSSFLPLLRSPDTRGEGVGAFRTRWEVIKSQYFLLLSPKSSLLFRLSHCPLGLWVETWRLHARRWQGMCVCVWECLCTCVRLLVTQNDVIAVLYFTNISHLHVISHQSKHWVSLIAKQNIYLHNLFDANSFSETQIIHISLGLWH